MEEKKEKVSRRAKKNVRVKTSIRIPYVNAVELKKLSKASGIDEAKIIGRGIQREITRLQELYPNWDKAMIVPTKEMLRCQREENGE